MDTRRTPRCGCMDNIKMDITDVGLSGADWIDLAQDWDHLMAFCEHGNEPSFSIKYCDILE